MSEPPFVLRRALRAITLLAVVFTALPVLAQSIKPHPPLPRGHRYYIKIDSIPQGAAVYLDSKDYGIVGYTPYTMRLPRGSYTVILDAQGFKEYTASISVVANAAFTYTLEKEVEPAVLDVEPSPPDNNARGASVSIDGVQVGTVPGTFSVPMVSGSRHQLQISQPGFQPYEQWLDLAEGEHRTLVVPLTPAGPTTGALLVDADQPGAQVFVDGTQKDSTPALVTGLAAGPHQVEVKKGDLDWKQVVTVTPGGEPQKVMAQLSGPGAAGVTIVTEPIGADILVDGQLVGKSPYKTTSLPAGQHVVAAQLSGYQPAQQTITVDPAQPQLVQLTLKSGTVSTGTISVVSAVPDAEVYIDGADVGKAPQEKEVPSGDHFITVHKDGFADFQQKVTVAAGAVAQVSADLKDVGSIRFISNVDGAAVYLDGEFVGKTSSNPVLEKSGVSTGTHVVDIKATGYYDYHNEQVQVGGGEQTIVDATLQLVPTGPTPEQLAATRRGLSSFGAHVVPPGRFTADVGTGLPYFIMGRATVGAKTFPWGGIDAGVEFRSFLVLNEIDVDGRLQFLNAGPFSMAAIADAGGGGGPNDRDTYFMDFGAVASLSFGQRVTISGRARVNLWDDRLCPVNDPQNPPRAQCQLTTAQVQSSNLVYAGINSSNDLFNRYTGARFMLGGAVEVAIDEMRSVFLVVEGPPFNHARADYMKDINGPYILWFSDPQAYFNVGFTLKF